MRLNSEASNEEMSEQQRQDQLVMSTHLLHQMQEVFNQLAVMQ